jgi:2,3-bisphosphoglycerate-independent phosphoglycerate mutase
VEAIRKELEFDGVEYHTGVSYRHVLKITRPASKAIKCDPPHDYLDENLEDHLPVATSPEGEDTAALLRDIVLKSNAILENHPVNIARAKRGEQKANYCWPWSIGKRPKMKTFVEMFGKTGGIVSAVDLIRGIGVYAGMDTIIVEGATGLWNTNYEGKADAALKLLEDHDLVYIHVEGPDEAGHEGSIEIKIRAIEELDKRLLTRVMNGVTEPTRFAILPDHYTPVKVRTHVGTPVPFAIMGPGIAPDSVGMYTEKNCATGAIGQIPGPEFMKLFLKD